MKTLARARDRAELIERLRRVRPESVRRWGRMSAHQMVCHLSDAFHMATGQRRVSPATGLLQRTIVRWVALYLPLPWPRGIRTRPETDQEAQGTSPSHFAADVARLEALVRSVGTRAVNLDGNLHPVFGAMSEAAWLRWGYLHMDHHLRQFGVDVE